MAHSLSCFIQIHESAKRGYSVQEGKDQNTNMRLHQWDAAKVIANSCQADGYLENGEVVVT